MLQSEFRTRIWKKGWRCWQKIVTGISRRPSCLLRRLETLKLTLRRRTGAQDRKSKHWKPVLKWRSMENHLLQLQVLKWRYHKRESKVTSKKCLVRAKTMWSLISDMTSRPTIGSRNQRTWSQWPIVRSLDSLTIKLQMILCKDGWMALLVEESLISVVG